MSEKLTYVPIAGIRPIGKQPVYNMEVDEYHNFSVNGGIIMHNCADSVRYFCKTMQLVRKANRKQHTPIWR